MGFRRNPFRTAYDKGHGVALTTVNLNEPVVRAIADRSERQLWQKLKN